jgi:hypothetical protein
MTTTTGPAPSRPRRTSPQARPVSAPLSAPPVVAAAATTPTTTTTTTTTLLTGQQAHAALDALAPHLAAQDWRARAAASADLASSLLPALPAGAALGRGLDALAQRLTDANTRVSVAALQVSLREREGQERTNTKKRPPKHAQLRLPPPGCFSLCPKSWWLCCAPPTAVVRGAPLRKITPPPT